MSIQLPDNELPIMYGVWIKGKGWLRGADVFADTSLEKATQVARLVRGSVRFIDQSIIDLEDRYIEEERKTLWHTFKNYLRNKGNTKDK